MGHSFGDGVIVAAIAAAIVAYLYFGHVERKRRLEIIHQERLAAMDKGIPLPELPLDPARIQKGPDPRATLVHGIVWSALGIGSMIALALFDVPGPAGLWVLPLPAARSSCARFVPGQAKFSSWIYRITFNQALNVKARVRYRAPHVSDQALAALPAQDRDPYDRLHNDRRQQAMLAFIEDLPEVYQAALRLHYWLGESVSDIAALLDVPENTVKSYLHRARRLLHARLAERGFDAR